MFSVTNKEKIHRHDLGRNKRKSLLWGRLVGDQAGLIYDSHLDTSLKPVTLKNKDKLNDSQDHTNHKIKQQFVPFLENIFCFWSKIKQIL